MCEENNLTQNSDNWQMFELGKLKVINETLII
jgi:hypothetical protein